MSYQTFADKTASQKITLCHIHASQRVNQWALDSGSTYIKTPEHFVTDVYESNVSLVQASNSTLSSGEWYYDIVTNVLYVRASDDANPNTKTVYLLYRFFYSTIPVDLPYDLSTGEVVPYKGLLKPVSQISQDLDDEQIGVALESSTRINFHNTSGHFDEIYDTVFWENKDVSLWSWSPEILLSEKQKIFSGVIQDRSFSTSSVGFQAKDSMYKLRKPVTMNLFSSSDGNVSDSFLDTPKRLLFGKFKQLECIPVDNVLGGFSLAGTISGAAESTTVTGVGTTFIDECSIGDKITVTLPNADIIEMTIDSIESDASLTISSELEANFAGLVGLNKPEIPFRKKNRTWHIAGHKLRAPSTTIASVEQDNRITIADASDFEAGDRITVDGESAIIKRISGSQFVLRQNLGTTPSVSGVVTKEPVTNCYIGSNEAVITRDFSVTNTTESLIVFEDTAEFNVARQKTINGTFTFTSTSRTVSATGVNLLDFLKPRDWIRNQSLTHTTWYEVLQVNSETELDLRIAYAGTTDAGVSAYIKNPNLIEDNTQITVNCVGLEESGVWRKTAADAIKYLVETDAGLVLDSDSFDESKIIAPEVLSLAIPEKPGGSIPTILKEVTKINKSVFGSLVHDSEFNLVYNVLDTTKPAELNVYKSHDIIGSATITSKNEVVKTVNAKYKPYKDLFSGDDLFTQYSFTNDFAVNSTATEREMDVTIYLYNEVEAQRIAQRYALYNSLSTSIITFRSKLKFFTNSLNDVVWVNFERMYKRFSNRDRQKIGIINKISKSGTDTSIELNDLGNIFNRVPSIAPSTANEFTSASDDEILYNGYVVDDVLETPDTSDETMLNSQIIG